MSSLHITRGLPASGKSTWARAWVAADPVGRARVNRDELRAALGVGPVGDRAQEQVVSAAQHAAIRADLLAGRDVVCDDTNLVLTYVQELVRIAEAAGAGVVLHDEFAEVPLQVCLERDADRPDPVGGAVIERMSRLLPVLPIS